MSKGHIAQQRCPIQLHQLGRVFFTRQGWRGRHAKLAQIEAFQTERQPALRTIEGAWPTKHNLFEIRRVPAFQRIYEGLVSCEIDQADPSLQNTFCVGSRLVGVESFVSVIDLRRWGYKRIVPGGLSATCEGPRDAMIGCGDWRNDAHGSSPLKGIDGVDLSAFGPAAVWLNSSLIGEEV